MNKISIVALSFFFYLTQGFGQIATQKEALIKTSKLLDQNIRASFSKAVLSAKEKGWPLSYQSGSNQQAKLVGIDAFGQPKYYISFIDPIQAITVNTNKVWASSNLGFNLSGAHDSITNRIGIWDEGVPRPTHKELLGRILQKDNATNIVDHSTHVAGIIMSKGISALSKGMAYGIKGAYSYDWNSDESEMAEAAANGLLISNHSYGTVTGWDYNSDSSRWEFNGRWNEKEDYRFGLYDESAQTYDSIAYNAPYYLIVKSAGNNRSSTGPAVGQPYWRRNQSGKWYNAGNRPDSLSSNNSFETLPADVNAKNILTVGAVAGIAAGYSKKEDVVMSSFSTWGPTDDGRIKPDIVADGISVYSSLSQNDSSYGYSSGTSMSSPGVAGSLLLLQELSQQLSPNKFITSSTVKALAIHTANEAGNNPGPDYKFGWGILNTSGAATVLKNALTNQNNNSSNDLVFENVLLTNESKTISVIASGNKPLKATIVWTDVKGSPNSVLNDATPKLVNDLDLSIHKGTNTYLPWTLNPRQPDATAIRSNNSVDNVEKVELDSTLVGETYNITVSHKGLLERGKQAYSLIVSGAGGNPYCTSSATNTSGTKIDSVSINNVNFLNNTSNQYINNSHLIINGEPNGLLKMYLKLGSVDQSNNARIVKVFIDYNNNSIFESTENPLTSGLLLNGIYDTSFHLPNNLPINNLTKLRIVVMETADSSSVKACDSYSVGETQDFTLKIIKPSNDLQVLEVLNPQSTSYKKEIQYVTIKLINNGSIDQSNIPLHLTIQEGANTLLNINETFTGTLNGFESMPYTFQHPFSIQENKTYTITATVSLSTDQQNDNNSHAHILMSKMSETPPTGSATLCNSTVKMTIASPISGANYFWYDSSNLVSPIAIGSSTTVNSSKSKLYLTKGYHGTVGPLTNTSLGSSGGYNNFYGNYVKISTTGPMTIETTKLYTGYPGKMDITLATLATQNDNGSYSYYPIQTVSLNVPASSPNPTAVSSSGSPFVAGDTGRIYALNLKIPQSGDYILIMKCDTNDGTSVFRNNGLGNSTYPIGPAKAFTITGNSVLASSGNFQNFYYFFYNTRISTDDDYSSSEVDVITAEKPTIVQVGDSLISSPSTSYQWYMNEETISGATNQSYKPLKNALYKVSASTGNCQLFSDNKLILITDVAEASAKEINLKITSDDYVENMIKGNGFYVQFSNIQTQEISLELMNSMGNRVFVKEKLNNQSTPQHINIPSLNTGIYFVKIYANKKMYIQRVLVTNH